MRFLHPEHDEQLELSLSDVFLVPGCWEGGSRLEVDLAPRDFAGGSQPIVSANMNAVTGKRMAETMARFGGLGVLPQDMALETVEAIVQHIKGADPRHDTPLLVAPGATLRDVHGIIRKRAHDMVVVTDDQRRPIGLVTTHDLRGKDQYTKASEVMSLDPVTIAVGTGNREAFLRMDEHRVKAAPVVDSEGRVVGALTRDDAVRLELVRPSVDTKGRLMVAAAVGISLQAAEIA
ncbi:MAG: CBS domain-containing protein, partial [Planctomycetota bacterium]